MALEITRIKLSIGLDDYLDYRGGSGGTVEVFDILVTSERRKGKGKKLLEKLFRTIDDHKMPSKRVFAITRTSNEIAQRFYEACGFEVAGVLRRFYGSESGADAVMYVRSSEGPI